MTSISTAECPPWYQPTHWSTDAAKWKACISLLRNRKTNSTESGYYVMTQATNSTWEVIEVAVDSFPVIHSGFLITKCKT